MSLRKQLARDQRGTICRENLKKKKKKLGRNKRETAERERSGRLLEKEVAAPKWRLMVRHDGIAACAAQ